MDFNRKEWSEEKIDAAYINALTNLINACRKNGVCIDEVKCFINGFVVTFEGLDGDAVCHDYSYGSPCYFENHKNDWGDNSGKWETIGFPWDDEDVSVHDSEELAELIGELQKEKELIEKIDKLTAEVEEEWEKAELMGKLQKG